MSKKVAQKSQKVVEPEEEVEELADEVDEMSLRQSVKKTRKPKPQKVEEETDEEEEAPKKKKPVAKKPANHNYGSAAWIRKHFTDANLQMGKAALDQLKTAPLDEISGLIKDCIEIAKELGMKRVDARVYNLAAKRRAV